MRKLVVVMIAVSTVLALSVGTALAENESADKGDGKGKERRAANKSTAAKGQTKGQERQAANKKITTAKNQASDKGADKEQNQGTSYVFKGTIAQNGVDGSPLEVKVEKVNDAARSFIGKNLTFDVSSDTEIYLDDAGIESSGLEESSGLDAKLSDLKAGNKVLIQAKAPKNTTSFTASLISAETSNTEGSTNTADTDTADTNKGTNAEGTKSVFRKGEG